MCYEWVAVKSTALSGIFFCRNCTKKPMNNQKEPAWITVTHQSSRLILFWRILVMYVFDLCCVVQYWHSWLLLFINLWLFFQVKYKDAYQKNILGHYLGSFEDPHHIHCMKVEAMKSDVSVAIILFSPSYFHFRESSIMVSYWMLILFLEKLQSRLWGGKDKMLLPSDHNSRVWSY